MLITKANDYLMSLYKQWHYTFINHIYENSVQCFSILNFMTKYEVFYFLVCLTIHFGSFFF